jgi:hypothetical protein
VLASLTFATPPGGLAALLVVVPLGALVLAARRVAHVREVLHLVAPDRRHGWARAGAVASVPLLLGLAVAQPGWRSQSSVTVRADAAVFVVIDTSSSMRAAAGPHAPTRLARAREVALATGAALPGVPLGVATFTDRVLPNLFPTADLAVFDSTIRGVGIDSPPPREASRVATAFSALAALGSQGFYTRAETHRAVVVITDGESRSFDATALARSLAAAPGVHLVVVRVGGGGDRLYSATGRPSGVYRADPARAEAAVAQLASSTGGRSLPARATVIAGAIGNAIGSGSSTRVSSRPETRGLGSLVVLVCLFPVLFTLWSGGYLRVIRRSP